MSEDNKEILTAEDVKELAPLYDQVVLALKQVYDPEIPVNIYDLGLIYELNINKKREASVTMTFTAPNCRWRTMCCQKRIAPLKTSPALPNARSN